MKNGWERRDVLLLLILIVLAINILLQLGPKRLEAETFRLDSCITTSPGDKPDSYVHVVNH